jgi:hypothetical protein
MSKAMAARYDGWCKGCNAAIAKGQQITHERIEGALSARTRHIECDAKPASGPRPVAVVAYCPPLRPVGAGITKPCRRCGTYCYGDCEVVS